MMCKSAITDLSDGVCLKLVVFMSIHIKYLLIVVLAASRKIGCYISAS